MKGTTTEDKGAEARLLLPALVEMGAGELGLEGGEGGGH